MADATTRSKTIALDTPAETMAALVSLRQCLMETLAGQGRHRLRRKKDPPKAGQIARGVTERGGIQRGRTSNWLGAWSLSGGRQSKPCEDKTTLRRREAGLVKEVFKV